VQPAHIIDTVAIAIAIAIAFVVSFVIHHYAKRAPWLAACF